MRKPYIISDILQDGAKVTIDLFEIARMFAIKDYTDQMTGEVISFDKEYCAIVMNSGTEYLADLSINEIIFFSKQMWKSKVKESVRELFKEV